MTVTAAKLRAVVTADTSQGQAGLKGFGNQVTQTAATTRSAVGGIGSAFGDMGGMIGTALGGMGIAFGAAQIVSFAKGTIMAASTANESLSKMQVVFGASGGAIKTFAQGAARDLGMSSQQAIEASATFGNLFTSMGVGQPAAASMSQGIVKLAADLGSFNNIPVDVMLEKLRSGMVGEVEPLRAVGMNLSAAAVNAKALQMGLADANGTVSQGALLQARYAVMLDQSKNAQGDFARTSDGLANSLKIAEGEVANIKVQLGDLTIRPYTAVVHVVSSGLSNLNTDLQAMSGDQAVRLPALQKQLAEMQKSYAAALADGVDAQGPAMTQLAGSIAAISEELRNAKSNAEIAGDAGVSAATRTAAAMYAANTASNDWGDAGVGAALRIAAAAETAAAKVRAITTIDNSNHAPAGPAYGTGTDFGAQLQAADKTNQYVVQLTAREVQTEYDQRVAANTRSADDYASKMKAAGAEIANSLKGEMSAGMNTAIGLLDLRGPAATDPNGPFRDMFRVLDVAKLGMASPWQQGLGIDQEQAKGIGKKFESGIWDDTVTKFIDVNALKTAVKDKQLGQQFMDAFAESLAGAATGSGTGKDKKAGIGETLVPGMLKSIDAQLVADASKLTDKGAKAYDSIEQGFIDQAKNSTVFISAINAMVDNSLARYAGAQ